MPDAARTVSPVGALRGGGGGAALPVCPGSGLGQRPQVCEKTQEEVNTGRGQSHLRPFMRKIGVNSMQPNTILLFTDRKGWC